MVRTIAAAPQIPLIALRKGAAAFVSRLFEQLREAKRNLDLAPCWLQDGGSGKP